MVVEEITFGSNPCHPTQWIGANQRVYTSRKSMADIISVARIFDR